MAKVSDAAPVAPEPHPQWTGWRRPFWCLWATQFQGAFSDNALKNLVLLALVGQGATPEDRYKMGELIGALFAAPFILFSLTGGFFADRFRKRTVTINLKVFEVTIMLLALAALAGEVLLLQVAAIFFMGMQSAFFGPSKYGLLPEILTEKRLSWGNGMIQMGTNVAIIIGTVFGVWLVEAFRGRQIVSGIILICLSLIGLAFSFGVLRAPAANPRRHFEWNPFKDLWSQWELIRADRVLRLALAGEVYFAFLGSLALLNIVFYGTEILHLIGSETKIGFLMAALGIGVGVGAAAAGYLSGRKIEYGLVPLGSMGLTAMCLVLGSSRLSYEGTLAGLALLGFCGGFYIVPLSAILQHRPPKERKGGVLATNNLLSFCGVFAASGAHYAMTHWLQLDPKGVFLWSGLLTLAGTVFAVSLLPDSLLRLLVWVFTHTVYRLRIVGRDNIPEKGGALFVCNHVSLVDALLLIGSTDRHIRFLMFKDIYEHPVVRPFARAMRAIPISSQQRPRELIKSLQAAREAILRRETVCIFAEGQITRIGQLLPFRRGLEKIIEATNAPILPVHLDGVWGSVFSFEHGRFLGKLPRKIPYPVTVSYGAPLPSTAAAFDVRQAVQELGAEAWRHRKPRMRTLSRTLISTARGRLFRFAMTDERTPPLRWGAVLLRTVFLARRLCPKWRDQPMVGLMLPPSVGGALANYAALLLGRVPVNLNYTVSAETVASCIRQCEIKTVLTSKAFWERANLPLPVETIFLEEIAAHPSFGERLAALLLAFALPARLLEAALRDDCLPARPDGLPPPESPMDELATVIFSSGSTGEPKGVMLTHFNVAANVQQLGQTFALGGGDRVLGTLPFFHSFGFTGTLAIPALLGVGAVYHPNPLDAGAIGELVSQHGVTFLLATPTFLQTYIRRCEPEAFGSLQYAIVGAEKLSDRVAEAFEEKFGLRPLEAYGCTECAPAVTVNTRDFRAAGFRQVGAKRGKIGHPLPGISVRIADPDTLQPLPVGHQGLLLVKGPNVMAGYLGHPEKTAEALKDGWYVTGDIAALDEDGFVRITDRLSRFSKIGGEMVPHVKVEEKLHELAGVTEQTFAVTSLPDESKGERLVVLHTLSDGKLQETLAKLSDCGLPNLWIPRPNQFFRVDALPYLGTGKLDLRAIRERAQQLSAT